MAKSHGGSVMTKRLATGTIMDGAVGSAAISAPSDLVDLARYPLTDLAAAPGKALLRHCREQLRSTSACVLEEFLSVQVASAARAELTPFLPAAHYCEKRHNPYLAEADPALADGHPRNRLQVSDVGALADDQIPEGSILRRLYTWPALRAFLAAVLEVPRLHPYADPLGSLNLNVYQPGQQHGWHFDNAAWSVTLMLQPAQRGGVYEYVPDIRTPDGEHYDRVARVLDGTDGDVRRLDMDIGALVMFRGRYTLHRVTPVEGPEPRLVAVLSYDPEPGVMLSEHNRVLFYGRAS
jgi:hypothetical protein